MANTRKAKTWYKKTWPAKTEHGGPPHIEHYVVTSGQLVYKGDIVILASGKVTAAATDATAVLGVALENGNGTNNDVVAVAVADAGTIFMMRLKAATAFSSYTVGTAYDLVTAGSGETIEHQLDTTTTQAVFQLLGLVPGDDGTDTTDQARVYVKVVKSQYYTP